MERMKKQIEFLMEIDKVKNIFRQTWLADGNRKDPVPGCSSGPVL